MFVAVLSYSEGIEHFVNIAKNDGNHIHLAIKYLAELDDPKYKRSLNCKTRYHSIDSGNMWSVEIRPAFIIDTTKSLTPSN